MNLQFRKEVYIPASGQKIEAELCIPEGASSVVMFAHGSGSSRFSKRNQKVANYLWQNHFGTLLLDLLTRKEDEVYHNRFNIELLAQRLIAATKWLQVQQETRNFKFGFFGASTGAAAALLAAVELPQIAAIVSRGGRPDLARDALSKVYAPVLLIVGSLDHEVLRLNQEALIHLKGVKKLEIVPGASHLFEEEGTLEEVCYLGAMWFRQYISKSDQ